MMEIAQLKPENKKIYLPQLREIFFLCSAQKAFASDQEKEDFYQRWTGYYLNSDAQAEVLLCISEPNTLAGYLMGCENSLEALSYFEDRIGSYKLFSDLFADYECHLHINAHPVFQGQGVGTRLIEHYKELLRKKDHKGLHIVTSPDAKNVPFYRKLGFAHEVERSWKGHPLLFMGCRL